jgi:hypothetical protein
MYASKCSSADDVIAGERGDQPEVVRDLAAGHEEHAAALDLIDELRHRARALAAQHLERRRRLARRDRAPPRARTRG